MNDVRQLAPLCYARQERTSIHAGGAAPATRLALSLRASILPFS
jgi:hypothetical protein